MDTDELDQVEQEALDLQAKVEELEAEVLRLRETLKWTRSELNQTRLGHIAIRIGEVLAA